MDNRFLQHAIALSEESVRSGQGGPFGAVIVREGAIVSSGMNRVTSACDPTEHAEIVAIRKACAELKRFHLEDCEIYSSCEPCPMCLGAIYWARLKGLYFAATREDAAAAQFDDAVLYDEIALEPERRRMKTAQALREQALGAFAAWNRKADKVPY
jgi:guanine deaminase